MSFTVSYAPTSVGAATDQLIIKGVDSTGAVNGGMLNLSGFGVSGITLNWPFLNLGVSQLVGSSSADWPVVVTNRTGSVLMPMVSSGSAFPVDASGCASIPQGGSCTLTVRFLPTVTWSPTWAR